MAISPITVLGKILILEIHPGIPAVKSFARLERDNTVSFLDRHYLMS